MILDFVSRLSPFRSVRPAYAAGVFLAAFALPQAAQTQEAEPALDPVAVEIAARSADFLASQQDVQVNWFVSYDSVLDGREKITHLRSGTNLLSRENGFYSFSEEGDRTREYFFDGASVSVFDLENNVYASAEASGRFEDLVKTLDSDYGIVLPIWQVLSREPDDRLLEDAESGAYLGLTRVAGEEAHHLAFSSYDHDWQIWIAADPERPVLLMLVGTNPYTQGWPQYRAYFSDWDFQPEIPEGTFTFVPDENADRLAWPRIGGAADGGQ